MARKGRGGGVSKSELIRQAHAASPTAGPTEIAKAILASNNIKISPAMVSTVLSQDKSRGGKPGKRGRPKKSATEAAGAPKKRGRGRPAAAKSSEGDVSINTLVRVKKLTEELGGIDKAKAALEALSRILG